MKRRGLLRPPHDVIALFARIEQPTGVSNLDLTAKSRFRTPVARFNGTVLNNAILGIYDDFRKICEKST